MAKRVKGRKEGRLFLCKTLWKGKGHCSALTEEIESSWPGYDLIIVAFTNFFKHADGFCSCGSPETVHHVLLACTNYRVERQQLFKELSNLGVPAF